MCLGAKRRHNVGWWRVARLRKRCVKFFSLAQNGNLFSLVQCLLSKYVALWRRSVSGWLTERVRPEWIIWSTFQHGSSRLYLFICLFFNETQVSVVMKHHKCMSASHSCTVSTELSYWKQRNIPVCPPEQPLEKPNVAPHSCWGGSGTGPALTVQLWAHFLFLCFVEYKPSTCFFTLR